MDQTTVVKVGRRISFALALSLILFLPVAYAGNTITLTSPKAQLNGSFGFSVAVNEGDPIVVIGAPIEAADSTAAAGNAYVLDTATGLITTLSSPAPQTDGGFGTSVAVSGTTVVVGAPGEPSGGKGKAGNAYVFDATTGSLITPLMSPAPQNDGSFGVSVSVSGTTVVVGAPSEPAGATPDAGNAYVFDATTGSLITPLTRPNPQTAGDFGRSVSVSGTTVVVGADDEKDGLTPDAGHAYVFDATDGSLIITLKSPTPQAAGDFGTSVAVSCTRVVVGAPGESVGLPAQSKAGHTYIFDSTTGFLTPATLTSPYAQAFGEFGYSVAVGGTTVVVGAPREAVALLAHAGHAYSFDASTGLLTTTLTSPNPQTAGVHNFGLSVAVSESDPIVVVGAYAESGGGYSGAGHAYIFF